MMQARCGGRGYLPWPHTTLSPLFPLWPWRKRRRGGGQPACMSPSADLSVPLSASHTPAVSADGSPSEGRTTGGARQGKGDWENNNRLLCYSGSIEKADRRLLASFAPVSSLLSSWSTQPLVAPSPWPWSEFGFAKSGEPKVHCKSDSSTSLAT